MKKIIFALAISLYITGCSSPHFIKSMGGGSKELLATADLLIATPPHEQREVFLALRNVEEARKLAQADNDIIALGNTYNVEGRIYRVSSDTMTAAIKAQKTAISYYEKSTYNPGLANSFYELAIAEDFAGNKKIACGHIKKSLEKFVAMQTTHPEVTIPVYAGGFKDFGELVRGHGKHMGCVD